LREGFVVSSEEGRQRVFYALTFMPFYILSRILLCRLFLSGFFLNDEIDAASKA